MTDELDDLKAALAAATPEPDPARRVGNIALAEKNFSKAQGSRAPARPNQQSGPLGRLLDGAGNMLNAMTTRAGLTATTAIVAVALVVALPQTRALLTPGGGMPGGLATTEIGRARLPATEDVRVTPEGSVPAPRQEGRAVLSDEVATSPDAMPAPAVRPAEADLSVRSDMVAPAAEAEIALDAFDGNASGLLREQAQGAAPARDLALTQPAPAPQAEAKRLIAPADPQAILPESDTEAFASAPENPVRVTADDPVSTFSIDVDTAAYAVVRSSLMAGMLPPRDAVRVEEMVNYFPYAYPSPEGTHPFQPTITVLPTPWNPGTSLVHVGIQGTLPAIADRPPLNLVFLIDTSGSMQDANKLPLLKQSFRLMLAELRPDDEVSIVTYAGSAGQVLEPTKAAERTRILAALDRLEAGGSTAGQAGLQQAYQVAEGMVAEGEVTRVILATDGDFNVGLADPEALKDFIADRRASGTYLSVLGFGRGNLDDATMQALAQNGNGSAAYIDTLSEARKVLVDQLTGALFPIANDVKIQIEFNPAMVAEYRLIGYETRALAREDFANDRVDAGDIGAGHTVTAIYEVTPVGSDAIRNGPLRYGQARDDRAAASGELGYFQLRYKRPGESTSMLVEQPIQPQQGAASDDVRFSVVVAGFGQLLKGGDHLVNWGWAEAIDLANAAKGHDPYGYRAEAVTLMRLAETLSTR